MTKLFACFTQPAQKIFTTNVNPVTLKLFSIVALPLDIVVS